MFRSVLVALDGSPFAEQALPWALSVARRGGASLDLVEVHVLYALKDPKPGRLPYDPAAEAECRSEERLYLDATARWLGAVSRVPITSAVVAGPEADGILRRIEEGRADLVVMATHGRGAVGRFLLGSVADEVIRRASVPVLLVHTGDAGAEPCLIPEPAVENIVVALDGSPLAEAALEPALDFARLLQSRCTLVRVASRLEDEAEAAGYLERVAARVWEQGLEARTRVAVARHPAEAVVAEAQAQGAGLIALATHGRSGVSRMLLGSVADQVVRTATTPVLVLRPADRDGQRRSGNACRAESTVN